jgi:hypothetical protein
MLSSIYGKLGLAVLNSDTHACQAFSAARIEQTTARIEDTSVQVAHTTLRVEQTLVVNNIENQVRLRRLEGMMARVLLETQFGQNVLNQTIEAISSVGAFERLSTVLVSPNFHEGSGPRKPRISVSFCTDHACH